MLKTRSQSTTLHNISCAKLSEEQSTSPPVCSPKKTILITKGYDEYEALVRFVKIMGKEDMTLWTKWKENEELRKISKFLGIYDSINIILGNSQ